MSRWAVGFAMIVACGLLVRAAADDTPVPTSSSLLARAPYLQRTSPTGTVVRWRTAQPMVGTIYFGTTWGDLVNSGTRLIRPGLSYEHELEIGGLTPGTRYYYAVASGASILAGNDEEHFFETHPVPGPPRNTRIWVLGDSGFEGPKQEAVRDSYYAFAGSRHTDLWLHVGDVSQSQGTDEQYQAEFFDGYVEMMRKSALLPTLGNHDGVNSDSDTLSGPYYENFTMPSAGEAGGMASGTEAYYSFDYANMHFIVLDSQDSDRSSAATC